MKLWVLFLMILSREKSLFSRVAIKIPECCSTNSVTDGKGKVGGPAPASKASF